MGPPTDHLCATRTLVPVVLPLQAFAANPTLAPPCSCLCSGWGRRTDAVSVWCAKRVSSGNGRTRGEDLMPLNAATEAERVSIAPMMDGGDLGSISMGCGWLCAADVHVSIAQSRAASRLCRFVVSETAKLNSRISFSEMSAKCAAFVGTSGPRQDPSFWLVSHGYSHGGLHLP